jgi:hypothetical protein
MITHAIAVGAAAARVRLPELIGETFRRPGAASTPAPAGAAAGGDDVATRPPVAGSPA